MASKLPPARRGAARRPGGADQPLEVEQELQVRPVRQSDLPEVIALDATVTGLHKADYWQRVYRRYGIGGQGLRHFLVAVHGGGVVGFMIGEVRDWEFGSPPCGWVFAIDVDPRARQQGVGTRLLAAMRERFERVGVRVLRTLLASDNPLILSFFRSQGMTAGRLIPLELAIGPGA
ncbi:MAG: GNAT family N-acetyltransferase [Rubrivivax sp.]|nr:GNAT family N-acetyltransferase [Rubrivivax sp.]